MQDIVAGMEKKSYLELNTVVGNINKGAFKEFKEEEEERRRRGEERRGAAATATRGSYLTGLCTLLALPH